MARATTLQRCLLGTCACLCCHCFDDERYLGSISGQPKPEPAQNSAGSAGMSGSGSAVTETGAAGALPSFGAFSPPRQISELAAADRDQYDATLSPDMRVIFFRSEPRSAPGNGASELVLATRGAPDASFGAPELVSEIDAPEAWNLAPDLSRNGLALWFSSDRSGGAGGLDLWLAKRASPNEPWAELENLAPLNSAGWDTDGSLSADQLLLVFSRRETGKNADLLWSRRLSAEEQWPAPRAVAELDTSADEWDPELALDGRMLLYTSSHSERVELDGSLHIYEARRPSLDVAFGPSRLVEELAAPGAIDEDPWLSNDGQVIVFSSTRDGRRHLYTAVRAPSAAP